MAHLSYGRPAETIQYVSISGVNAAKIDLGVNSDKSITLAQHSSEGGLITLKGKDAKLIAEFFISLRKIRLAAESKLHTDLMFYKIVPGFEVRNEEDGNAADIGNAVVIGARSVVGRGMFSVLSKISDQFRENAIDDMFKEPSKQMHREGDALKSELD